MPKFFEIYVLLFTQVIFITVVEKGSHALFRTCAFNGKFNEIKGKLFRAAQSSRKRNVATEDLIEEVTFVFIKN